MKIILVMTNYASTVYQSLDKDHDVIGVNVLPHKLMRFLCNKNVVKHPYYTSSRPQLRCLH